MAAVDNFSPDKSGESSGKIDCKRLVVDLNELIGSEKRERSNKTNRLTE